MSMYTTYHTDSNVPDTDPYRHFVRLHDGRGGFAPLAACESADESRLLSHCLNAAIDGHHDQVIDALEAYLRPDAEVAEHVPYALRGDEPKEVQP